MKQQLEKIVHTKKRCLENCKRKTAAEALMMSGTKSLLQDDASTEYDSGDTGIATQTDPVSLADASTSTSTHCVTHEATMTDNVHNIPSVLVSHFLTPKHVLCVLNWQLSR